MKKSIALILVCLIGSAMILAGCAAKPTANPLPSMVPSPTTTTAPTPVPEVTVSPSQMTIMPNYSPAESLLPGQSPAANAESPSLTAMGSSSVICDAQTIADLAVQNPQVTQTYVMRSADTCVVGIAISDESEGARICSELERLILKADPLLQTCAVSYEEDILLRMKSLKEEQDLGNIVSEWIRELDDLLEKVLAHK